MAELFGETYSRQEIRSRIGDLGQLAGVQRIVLDDGHSRGVRAAIVRTGSGLEFEILLDRAMDIGRASFNGMPLAYKAPWGDPHPSYYNSESLNWLRTFGVGLLTTCGTQNVGGPSTTLDGVKHGLHGGITATPATEINVETRWVGDNCHFTISGKMREVSERGLFGPHICLHRTWKTQLGSNTIELIDEIENEGFTPAPAMLLYHVNLGWAIVDQGSKLICASREVTPRNETAASGLKEHAEFSAPIAGFQEQVYFHEQIPDAKGTVLAGIVSPERADGQLGLFVEYNKRELPRFTQWKQLGAGVYVCGLEPSNCTLNGQHWEREQGVLPQLQPGEKKSYQLKFHVVADRTEIASFVRKIEQSKLQ